MLLCLKQTLEVATYRKNNLLCKKTELILKCRHQKKCTFSKYDTKDWRHLYSKKLLYCNVPFANNISAEDCLVVTSMKLCVPNKSNIYIYIYIYICFHSNNFVLFPFKKFFYVPVFFVFLRRFLRYFKYYCFPLKPFFLFLFHLFYLCFSSVKKLGTTNFYQLQNQSIWGTVFTGQERLWRIYQVILF